MSYVLVNAYSSTPGAFASIKYSLSNFWTGTTAANGNVLGNMFPVILKI